MPRFVPFLAAPSPADAEAVESRLEAGSTRHDTSINLCLLMRAPVPVRSTDTWLPHEIGGYSPSPALWGWAPCDNDMPSLAQRRQFGTVRSTSPCLSLGAPTKYLFFLFPVPSKFNQRNGPWMGCWRQMSRPLLGLRCVDRHGLLRVPGRLWSGLVWSDLAWFDSGSGVGE